MDGETYSTICVNGLSLRDAGWLSRARRLSASVSA